MKTLTLLFLMPLISLIDINAQISANKALLKDADVRNNRTDLAHSNDDVHNNDLELIHAIGKSWKNPNVPKNLLKQIDYIIKDLSKEKAKYQAKLNDLTHPLTERQKEKNKRAIAEIDKRINELTKSITDIERVGNDKEHIYSLDILYDFDAHHVVKGEGKEVILEASKDAQLVHEIRHISLSLKSKKGLQFTKNGYLLAVNAEGIEDELQAYRAQYAFLPFSLPGKTTRCFEDINVNYLGSLQLADGSYTYPNIHTILLDETKMAKKSLKMDEKKISQANTVIDTYKLNKNHQILKQKVRE